MRLQYGALYSKNLKQSTREHIIDNHERKEKGFETKYEDRF